MDSIDRNICEHLQRHGRATSAEVAEAVGVSVSTANERVRRLVSSGVISGWQAVLDRDAVGAPMCAFMFVDMNYEGEQAACEALSRLPEVMELHHISGSHSYLAKVRVKDSRSLQLFLQDKLKPLPAVRQTETLLSLDALKETLAVRVSDPESKG